GAAKERMQPVEEVRSVGPITSIHQLARAGISRATLLRLAAADAFRSLGLDRREALWQILALDAEGIEQSINLFADTLPIEPLPALPSTPLDETVAQDYDTIGFSLNAHPMELVRAELDALGCEYAAQARSPAWRSQKFKVPQVIRNADLKQTRPGQRVAVSGLVTVRQRPGTAKGIIFMTLEDETSMANLIIRPDIWDRDREIARGRVALIAEGVVERQGDVIHVMVRQFFDLAATL